VRKTALFLCAAIACATPSTPFEGHPVLVGIDFVGNHSIKASELRDKIATQPTSGLFSKTVRYYDADLFAIDQKRIVRWYNEKGFYEARIVNVEERADSAGRVTLVVHIEEGRRARVQSIQWADVQPLTDDEVDDIDGVLPMHVNDAFDEDDYEKSKEVIQERLREHGFAEAKVSGQVRVNPQDATARIVYRLRPGKRFKFGPVMVTGTRAISPEQIARATGIDPGDSYRPSALVLAQQRVYNLGAFAGARVTTEPLGDQPIAAVRVTVREAPFHTLRFGVGGQVEEARWELPRLRAEYTNRNLFGGLRRLELASTVGYAFVPDIGRALAGGIGTKTGIVTLTSAQLTVPIVSLPGLDFVSRGEFGREIQNGFSYDEVAARFTLFYRRGRHSVALASNFVRYFQGTLDVDLQTLINQGGQSLGILASNNCIPSCTLTYPELRYTYDSRDNVLEPTNGFFATADFQQTLKPGSFTYFRFEPEVRAYFPMSRYGVFAVRAQYGALILEGPNQDAQASPFTQRFFGGGQSYQRGYAPLQQGPKIGAGIVATSSAGDCTNAPGGCPIGFQAGKFSNWVPIGGNGAMLLSAEARFHTDFVLNHTEFVLFTDASRITPNPQPPWQGRLEVAPGVGLRYLTPFGPIRFDIAYLLNPIPVVLPGVAQANGAAPAPTVVASQCSGYPSTQPCLFQRRWAFHVTLGEAF
jgi:translocation and assembly module TamA